MLWLAASWRAYLVANYKCGNRMGATAPISMELQIKLCQYTSDETIRKNVEHSITLDLPLLKLDSCSGTVSICGGGPSLEDTYRDLKGDVMACNGTYDFLLKKGIIPKYLFLWDPGQKILDYLDNLQKETTYIVSSACCPELFKKLEGYDVLLFHAYAEPVIQEVLTEKGKKGEYMIPGGCCAMTRSPVVAYFMGYREIHLHGADSSLKDGKSHVGDGTPNRNVIDVTCAGRTFYTPTWLAAQAEEFIPIVQNLMPQAKVKVHGDGLLPHIAKQHGYV